MPYWRLFYHLVWSTKDRLPRIDDPMTQTLDRSFRATCHELDTIVHAIGIMPDHVHLALSNPPSVAVSAAAGRLKGSSSHLLNRTNGAPHQSSFAWQPEYGVLSFGERALPDVIAYVTNQPARHAADTLWSPLERIAPLPPTPTTSPNHDSTRPHPRGRTPQS